MKKRFLWLMVTVSLLAGLFSGCVKENMSHVSEYSAPEKVAELPDVEEAYGVAVAVLYDGNCDDIRWQDTVDLLEQSVMLGLTVEAVDVTAAYELCAFDVVIPDANLADSIIMDQLSENLMAFTEQGGCVLLDNAFCTVLPMAYLGISQNIKLETCPVDMIFPEIGEDLGSVQEVIADFAMLYPEYYEAEALLQQDYGYGFITNDAIALATCNDTAVYTFHKYGKGCVMLTNPLLPNIFSLGNYSMTHREAGESAFASTTASCNQLLYSRVAAYAAKQKYGYALNRVYGYHGSPSMAWELHYEEITAYANDAMSVFDKICREYQQIPSYTIIRNSYWWFLRAESITYLKNLNTDGYTFAMDYEESAYSSGTHIVSDGQWLSLGKIENAGSYFKEYPEYDYRPYPCFGDADGDGEVELISGSYDGSVYCYDNLSYTDRLFVSEAEKLSGVQVSGFSAPQMADLDADGVPELICGADDGNIYLFKGDNNNGYVNEGVLIATDIPGQVLPAAGDVNGDGIVDLVVGSDQGVLLLYYGQLIDGGVVFNWHAMESYSKLCANEGFGKFLAPAVVDWNGDGSLDLAVGTFDGYIALLMGNGEGAMLPGGYVDIDEMNYKGNHHVKFGNYCVPVFFDLDRDGAKDLVCGSLEYGMAYPIDSEYFPYRTELQAQLGYAKENYQYLGVHHYSNAFASADREAYELQRHLEAFDHYGVNTDGIGANAHTWYTSTLGDTLTFDAEFSAGLLWNSGFSSPSDPGAAPQYAAENVIALPFFLQKDGEDTLLIQNNSVLPYVDVAWSDISAKYNMPVCVYYHCDFAYVDEAGPRDYVQKVSDFQYRYGYNFVREDQMMAASAAARQLEVSAMTENGTLSILPANDLSRSCMGLQLEFSECVDATAFYPSAKVWHREDNCIYMSLDNGVFVSTEEKYSPLRQVNLPAEIRMDEQGISVEFLDDGMQQVVTEHGWTTDSSGWTVTERENCTIFTHYGDAEILYLSKIEE